MMATDLDVLIIGAGISGIGVACHLARQCPGKRVAILERRQALGGTWDLFRYPGIRSDSDMLTYGYRFRPWIGTSVLADGPSIKRYLEETARECGVDRLVRFGLRSTRCDWSSAEQRWTVTAVDERSGQTEQFRCRFLVAATGYFNHDAGHQPDFAGVERFQGRVVHPQHWPEDLDYRGRRVVVIGSGATAVTLVPAMAGDAAHVTMLQRSPTYIYPVPAEDKLGAALQRLLPARWTYPLLRWRNIRLQRVVYKASRRFPQLMRRFFLAGVRRQLGQGAEMHHFTPRYGPWDQRLCAVPDGDLFKALRSGKASVVTDEIDSFTETGLRLKSGRELEADIVVSATGLQLQILGGTELWVDGQRLQPGERMTYKSVLLQDVPNFATVFGYTNISWTLKVDLAAGYVCRLLQEMDRRGAAVVTPRAPAGEMLDESVMDALSAGYVRRGHAVLPKQGRGGPWRVTHAYEQDRAMLAGPVDDAALQWSGA
jgi:monooxygenase